MYEQKHDDRSLSSKANDASDVLPDMVVLSSHEQDWQGLSAMKLHQVYDDLSAPALANHAVIIALTDLPTMKASLSGQNEVRRHFDSASRIIKQVASL
jgi:hypothetical protein